MLLFFAKEEINTTAVRYCQNKVVILKNSMKPTGRLPLLSGIRNERVKIPH